MLVLNLLIYRRRVRSVWMRRERESECSVSRRMISLQRMLLFVFDELLKQTRVKKKTRAYWRIGRENFDRTRFISWRAKCNPSHEKKEENWKETTRHAVLVVVSTQQPLHTHSPSSSTCSVQTNWMKCKATKREWEWRGRERTRKKNERSLQSCPVQIRLKWMAVR